MSYAAEKFFGVADIIGAFAAGLIIASTTKGSYIATKFQPMQYLFLTPIFFANIGIKVVLPGMSLSIVLFALLLVVTAILSKLIGCGLGAKLSGFTLRESVQTGFGMACRGEVALIVANKGTAMGLMPDAFFGPVIIMVVCCAVFTPVLLKLVFRPAKAGAEALQANPLADRLDAPAQLDVISDQLLTADRDMQKKS